MPERPDETNDAERARRALRAALGSFLTGVTIVTTTDADGRPRGITANSFTSVSLDPPLVLVCIDCGAASYDAFTTSGHYAVNILGQEHQSVAEVFASKRTDKFASVSTTTSAVGNPVITDAIAWLDCTTTDMHVIGDHAVLIGRVEGFGGEGGQPLGFHQGRFLSFKPLEASGLPATGEVHVFWILEDLRGRVVLKEEGDGSLRLPGTLLHTRDLTDEGLAEAASASVGADAVVDFLYSFYTDEQDGRLSVAYRGRLNGAEPSAAGCRLVRLTDSLWQSVRGDVELAVLKRYRVEREVQRFGIYAGTAAQGSVASIHEVRPDLADPEETA